MYLIDTSPWIAHFSRSDPFDLRSICSPDERVLAVALYRVARKQGRTVRASADCLVAAAAIRHDLTVVHRDRDYTAIASVSTLRERTIA